MTPAAVLEAPAAPPALSGELHATYRELCELGWLDIGALVRRLLGVELWSEQVKVLTQFQRAARGEIPSRMTVAGGHTTGKTFVVGHVLIPLLVLVPHALVPGLGPNPRVEVLCMASTRDQARSVLWEEVDGAWAEAPVLLSPERPLSEEWRVGPGRVVRIQAIGHKKAALQGHHADLQVVALDENAVDIDEKTLTALDSVLSGAFCFMVATLNPVHGAGALAKAPMRPSLYTHVAISCLDHPNVVEDREVIPGGVMRSWVRRLVSEKLGQAAVPDDMPWEELDAKLRDRTLTHPDIDGRILGLYPQSLRDTFIAFHWLKRNDEHHRPWNYNHPCGHIGVDVALQGADECVFVYLSPELELVDLYRCTETIGPRIAAELVQFAQRHGFTKRWSHHIHIEAPGVGYAVIHPLWEAGWDVEAVEPGGGLHGDWDDLIGESSQIGNRRSELWTVAGVLAERGYLRIPLHYDQCVEQLCNVKKRYSLSTSKILAAEKDRMRKELGYSPDQADAVIMALSRATSFKDFEDEDAVPLGNEW